MTKTVVGLFSSRADADRVVADLNAASIGSANCAVLSEADAKGEAFLLALAEMGIPDADAKSYLLGMREGHCLVTVREPPERARLAAEIMLRHHPMGIKELLAGGVVAEPLMGVSIFEGLKKTFIRGDEVKVPVYEERLEVGKRAVARGGMRVSHKIVERPAEAKVKLREEQVRVEHHPVDRAVPNSTWDSFRAEDAEIRERGEEAIATRSAHLVEEVVIDRKVAEHEETVRDTVRSTEVNVARTAAAPAAPIAAAAPGGKVSLKSRTNVDGSVVVPIVEEEFEVGKREVDRGGVRISERIVERPAEARVALRDEHVTVARRTTDQPLAGADWDLADETIEVTESGEEPVIAKSTHLVDEVTIRKDVTEREENVRGTVHRTDLRVETFHTPALAALEGDFRAHFAGLRRSDMDFTTAAPAYAYGWEAARDARTSGKDWKAIERDLQADYQKRYPKGAWDKARDAIKFAWDKARSVH
jgi:uncharacterized protein (TIGR02271 family)